MPIDAASVGTLLARGAFVLTVGSLPLSVARKSRPARLVLGAAATLLVCATAVLGWAFVHVDPALAEVSVVSTRTRPWFERLAGLWGASRPSLLLWTAMLAIAFVCANNRRVATGLARDEADTHRVGMIFSATLQAGFLAVVLFVADPFHRLDIPVIDGVGLSPILRHPAMLVHPPLLYAGQVIAIVLGVRTMAELVASGRLGPDWSGWSRRWALGAAGVTGAALGLGGWWAYAELGWGGFWAWDPVENAGLLPWLAAIMVVHALVGGAQRVAAVLAMVAGGFALAGGALTRSGVGISVHSFTPNRAVGRALTAILIAFAVCAVVAVATMRKTNPKGFAAAPRVRTLATRKLVIPVATVLFLATTIVVAMGTGVPLLFGDRVTTAAFYSGFTGPIALVAVAGVGVGPLAFRGIRVVDRAMIVAFGWGVIAGGVIAVSTGSPFAALTAALTPPSLLGLVRSGRRSRAMLAHVGAIALLVGIAGTTAGHDTSGWLRVGESKAVAGWTATLRGVDAVRGEDRERIVATVDVSGPGRKATVRPSADRWDGWTGPLAETASITSSGTHVQVVLRRVLDDPTTALIDVHVRPLLPLVWFGAFLLSVGTLVGLRRRAQPTSH